MVNGWAGVNGRVFSIQHILGWVYGESFAYVILKEEGAKGGWSWFGLRETVLFSKASVTSNGDVSKRNLLPESKFE